MNADVTKAGVLDVGLASTGAMQHAIAMVDLSRGANSPLDAAALDIAIAGAVAGTVDIMIFLLGEDRKVRSDADFVFFNQPTSTEGAIRLIAADRVTINLTAVPAGVHVLAVAVALSDTASGTLAQIRGLAVTAAGVSAPALGLTTERSAVLIEVYRRGPKWKIRNVSAGWTDGLAALVREHGVVVDDPGPTTQSTHPRPTSEPSKTVAALTAPNPAVAVAAPPLTFPAAPSAAISGLVLGKKTGKLSLVKGQRVSIEKSPLIVASISWPPATDYDVYALVRCRDGQTFTVAQFGTWEDDTFSTATPDGAVRHTGDVRRSSNSAATERIEIRLNPNIIAVVPVVYSAQSNGTGSFREYMVSMTIDNGQGTCVQIDAANAKRNPFVYTCVPGIIVNSDDGLTILALEKYSKPSSENRPVITKSLSIKMDAGAMNAYK